MAMRKPHHKSKLGCTTCKKRRVKCGLERPSCENCRKRGLECSFPTSPAGNQLSASSATLEEKSLSRVLVLSPSPNARLGRPFSTPSPPALLDTITQSGLVLDVPDELRLRFKQVVHHFITTTSSTLSVGVSGQTAWATALPQIVTSHPYVLDGIVAVTALHLSRCLGFESERRINFNIANDRLNKGLTQYRTGLEHVTADNASALFVFSTIISSWTLITIGDESKAILESMKGRCSSATQHRDNTANLVFLTTRLFRCMRGVLIIIVPHWHQLVRGPLAPILTRKSWPNRVPVSPRAIEEDLRLQELEKLYMRPDKGFDYNYDILASTLKQLRECFALVNELTVADRQSGAETDIETLTDWTAALVWVVHTHPAFTRLLEERLPEAWVILAHFAILPARVKGILWLESLPSNLVSTAALVLGEARWDLIDWPIRIVGPNLDSLRTGGSGAPSPVSITTISTPEAARST